MKPTKSIYILLSLFLMFSCDDNSVEPLVCGEGTTELNGECILDCSEGFIVVDGECVCQEGYTKIDNSCYFNTDLNILKTLFDLSNSLTCNSITHIIELCQGPGSPFCSFDSTGRLFYLRLMGLELNGEIPSNIGELSNLIHLNLFSNSLYGQIPQSICDLPIDWSNTDPYLGNSNISHNDLCPPYPDCLVNTEPFTDENGNGIWDESEPYIDTNENGIYEEDYVGSQSTSECGN